jgi:hypothetical protein
MFFQLGVITIILQLYLSSIDGLEVAVSASLQVTVFEMPMI